MAKLGLYFLLLFSFHYTRVSSASSASNPGATNFIKASCRATLYPLLCFQSLSSYASKIQQNERALAQAALSVSLARARYASVFVSKMTRARGMKPREHQAVIDCVENMGDSVDELNKSIKEIDQMGRRIRGREQDFMWHISNVQTWVSAALTNENTCVDGFSWQFMEGNVKAAIKRRVISVAQVTSNALALVNRFAARHKAAAAAAAINMP